MPATYEPIATTTLGSAAASITFSSIASSWTDLRLAWTGTSTINTVSMRLRFNADSATNYSNTTFLGDGSAAASYRNTNRPQIDLPPTGGVSTTVPTFITVDVFSYAGSTFKTVLATGSDDRNGSGYATRDVGLWRSTSAITELALSVSSGNFAIGTTATLYGIKNA
jgi:hypothetical protein